MSQSIYQAESLKWWQTIKVSWSNLTAYRLNFFLQIIGPALVFFFIKYNLWSAIYAGDNTQLIQGYTFKDMISYHSWALIVGLLAQGHASMNLSEDIRMGRISSYLIYPFNFWQFHTASFLSFQILQTFIASGSLLAIVLWDVIPAPGIMTLLKGLFFTWFVSIFWFAIQYLLGLMAFWLEETWILRVIFGIMSSFLSGAIIPLDLFPSWAIKVLDLTPFPYLTYYPIKAFMGQGEGMFLGCLIMGAWIAVFAYLNHRIWKKGVRLYTAAGM